jgi:hypothetical protein
LQFCAVRPQNRAIGADTMQGDTGILEEVGQVVATAAELG